MEKTHRNRTHFKTINTPHKIWSITTSLLYTLTHAFRQTATRRTKNIYIFSKYGITHDIISRWLIFFYKYIFNQTYFPFHQTMHGMLHKYITQNRRGKKKEEKNNYFFLIYFFLLTFTFPLNKTPIRPGLLKFLL